MPGGALLDYFLDIVGFEERLAIHGKVVAVFDPDERVAARTGFFPEPESDLSSLLVEIKGNILEPVAYHLLHVAVEGHASFVDGHVRREKHSTPHAPLRYEFLVCHLLLPPLPSLFIFFRRRLRNGAKPQKRKDSKWVVWKGHRFFHPPPHVLGIS